MSQSVPASVFNLAAGLAAIGAQEEALAAERVALSSEYLAVMQNLQADGDLSELLDALKGFAVVYGTGWAKVAKTAGLPDRRALENRLLSVYNDGEGRWTGAFPLAPGDLRPARGTWVVYQLIRGDELLYIGSTGAFMDRIKAHAREKAFDSWRAAECENEPHCRALEGALIDRYRPPLNRVIPTPRLVLA